MLDLRKFKTISLRRKALEKALGISLKNIGHYSSELEVASSRNCENMIGVAQVPLGVAGPLRLSFAGARDRSGQAGQHSLEFYVPLTTTEGALVASVNRGCQAIGLSGGAIVLVENVGITRGPVFKTNSLLKSFELKNWLEEHFNDLNKQSKKTSSHLELKKVKTQILGRNVFVRFYFDTSQAMGMNMATLAVDKIVPYIEKKTDSRCFSLSGNFCVDKKPAWLNFILGRGKKVWAEAVIKKEVAKEVLKTTSQKICEVWLNKCLLGSALSGSLGFNAHFSNIIAAIFCATGQDLAQVTEGALGVTQVEVEKNGDLYISVYLPDLPLGTIGGGTGLPIQKEAISIIFGHSKPLVEVLAKVIGGAVLAGELSLLASLAQGSLAQAHLRLARGYHA
jgi:hydroxymethylglutaryl-CoA reductase (NADPH)